jgi:hypothetical protein
MPTQPMLHRRKARWSEILQAYDFQWVYKPGRTNVADPLSRIDRIALQSTLTCPPEHTLAAIGGPHPRTFRSTGADIRPTLLASYPTLIEQIKEGYKKDPWFSRPERTVGLLSQHDLWYKGDRVVVPDITEIKEAIFHELHSAPYSGHFGVNKTVSQISRRFFWPRLRNFVQKHIKTCECCQRHKASNQKPQGPLRPLPVPSSKWDSIGVDFIVHLPKTLTGYNAICVFVDRLTKMVHLCPTTDECDGVETAELFIKHVWKHHGTPASIVSDRGTVFTGNFITRLMALLGVKQLLTTAYHPETDGQTERVNRVLQDCLRHYVAPTQDDWDTHLPYVEFAINTSKHASTHETPFFLNYGHHPRVPLDLHLPKADNSPGVAKFARRMQDALALAKKCMEQAAQRQKAYADTKRSPVQIKLHDQVLLSTKNINLKSPGTKKLLPKWIGPFTVVKDINGIAFKLALPVTMSKVHPVFHASLLKPYFPSGSTQPPTPPIIDAEGDVVFFVETILDHRLRKSGRKNITEYLIKWRGYSHEHNTWEPETNIFDADLITDYKKRRALTAESVISRKQSITASRKRSLSRSRS